MAATDPLAPEPRRNSIRLPRLLCIASALIVGVVAGLSLHYKLDDLRAPAANRASGTIPDVSARTLFAAINDDNLKDVNRLIDGGADVNSHDTVWETPLMRAAFGGEPRIVERLLAAGASVSAQDKSGQTAMHFAARGLDESPRIVAALIAAGAAVDAPDADGETPLMLAADGPSVPKLKMLLANGANPNAADHRGYTPLIYSVCKHTDARRLAERVQLLLNHGADSNARANNGQTALDLASQQLELYSDPEFTGTQKALLAGANEQAQKMDLDTEIEAEMRKTFAEVGRMTQEANAAAKKNFPVVVRLLRDRRK
jgi:hypothetical protein